MIKVFTVFGTRPEAIKMAPLIYELELAAAAALDAAIAAHIAACWAAIREIVAPSTAVFMVVFLLCAI